MTTERRYDIDWLRVIAIGLLLIYHIAIVFQPWAMFIGFIRSDELWEGLWTPMTLLNVWRIPLLFFVSGMGVYFAMRKRTMVQLLVERGKRIFLPYLFGIIAIVPLHYFIFQDYYGQPAQYFPHPSHLWFLGNIVIYLSALFAIFYRWMSDPESRFRNVLVRLFSHPLGLLSVTVFFVAEAVLVNPANFALYAQTLHGYAIGFLAFFFGYVFMYVGQPFWNTVLQWRWLYIGLAAGLYGVRLVMFDTAAPNYLLAIESNLWIFGLFGLSYRHLNRPSKVLSYLSKAAYPVYIVHMIALYGASSLILPLALPVAMKFVLIVVLTALVCFALFEGIKRIPLLRNCFGISVNTNNRDTVIAKSADHPLQMN